MMMTDWSSGVEARNYKIPHRTDSRNLRDLLASIACILVIAGSLVGHLWIRSQIVSLGYGVQELKETEKSLMRIQTSLILEEETLKQPQRIDFIARNVLAMEPLLPNQLIPRFRDIEAGRPAVLALANTNQPSAQPRRPSANN